MSTWKHARFSKVTHLWLAAVTACVEFARHPSDKTAIVHPNLLESVDGGFGNVEYLPVTRCVKEGRWNELRAGREVTAVVNSIDRSAENRAPNRCLPFDGIGAWHPGIVASSGYTFTVNGYPVLASGVNRDAEPQCYQKVNNDLGLCSRRNGLSN